MTESKKVWVEPELIVLVRNKPEEAILGACKLISTGGSITDDVTGCSDGVCSACSVLTGT